MELVSPGIGLIFWMLISFSAVLFILAKFAWKPILQMLKERETSIAEALQSAQRAKEEMAKLQADNEKILNQAKIERDQLLKEAREIKEKIISDARNQATIEANKIITSAKITIENEKKSAINEIKNEVVTLSVDIAKKIIQKELSNETSQKDYIESLLKNVKLN